MIRTSLTWRSCAAAGVALTLALASACSGSEGGSDDFSAVYVMSDNLGDKGFNDSAKAGFDKAKKDGVSTRLLQASPDDPQLWRQNLESVSSSGKYDLVFTGPGMHDNLADIAPANPDQKYVFFDDELDEPNVASVKYAQNEGSFLAGALAAQATLDTDAFPLADGSKKLAIVAGQDLPIIQDFIVGFEQGVAAVDDSISVDVSFVGNFNDAQKAYDLTETAIGGGADVVYNVSGPAGLGILKAAADNDTYAIGVDSDQNGLHPEHVLGSMLKQIGNSVYDSIELERAGELKFGELTVYGLANDGVTLVYNEDLVSEEVQDKVSELKQQVVDGEITVESAFD